MADGEALRETVYASLKRLAELEYDARGFSLLPRQPVASILAGRHASRLRGRGLNFEELRGYIRGDDIRNIDWKATARMRKPFVRVYSEERDRPVVLVVDQRSSMFFGTRLYMKSVTALHVAALFAWRAFHAGDRVGAVIFNDSEVRRIAPHRSRRQVLRILGAGVRANRMLRAETTGDSGAAMLDEALGRARRMAGHDNLIVIVSDLAGAGEETRQLILTAVEHNDVVAALVHDPAAMELPAAARLVVTDGELQVELNLADRRVREPVLAFTRGRLRETEEFLKSLAIPVLPVHTGAEAAGQVRVLLGGR